MYLNDGATDGGARVLSPDSVRSMFLDRVPDPAGDTYYGMGWTSFYWDDGELVLSHDGQVENYVASMCLLPERGIGVAVLGDANDNAGGNDRFFDLAGGVVSVAVGGAPEPVDVAWTALWRQRTDVLYACALLAAPRPLLLRRSLDRRRTGGRRDGRTRAALLAAGLALHVALPRSHPRAAVRMGRALARPARVRPRRRRSCSSGRRGAARRRGCGEARAARDDAGGETSSPKRANALR